MTPERYSEIRLAALAKIALRDAEMMAVTIEELCSQGDGDTRQIDDATNHDHDHEPNS
ncbi:hypothetical protein WEU32_06830 [Brevundimonas sp. BH3]|uniref:hypothetical protein n=1 Tax=Brevundimonas sp. BH3 TaxID=3133089 RepID=UPI003255F405